MLHFSEVTVTKQHQKKIGRKNTSFIDRVLEKYKYQRIVLTS